MIRNVRTADAAALCRIYNHYIDHTIISFETERVTAEEMAARIEGVQQRFPWLVDERDGQLLGYAYATAWRAREAYRHTAESTVYVDPDVHGGGVGRLLYEALLARLPEHEVHSVIAVISLPNEASEAFHQRLGFERVAYFKQVGWKFDRWIDSSYWQRLLG